MTDPALLGVGAVLQLVSAMLCKTTLRYFGLGTISVLSLCNSRSRSRRSYLTPTSFSVQILKRIFCEWWVWTRSSASLGPAMEITHIYLNENIQLIICKELWSCTTSVETLLFKAFCHEVYPACSSALSTESTVVFADCIVQMLHNSESLLTS